MGLFELGDHVAEYRLRVLVARRHSRLVPVAVVSDPDWLLAGGADAGVGDFREELFRARVGQHLVQVPLRVRQVRLLGDFAAHAVALGQWLAGSRQGSLAFDFVFQAQGLGRGKWCLDSHLS